MQSMKTALLLGSSILAVALVTPATAQFVPAFPNAVFITTDVGTVGGPADFVAEGTFAADEDGVLDVFVLFGPKGLQSPPVEFTYSSTFSWENPAADARLKEWVGNFNFNPPVAASITDSGDAATTPGEFQLAADQLSATINSRTFEAFPFPVERYHGQISGLQPGENVVFQKIASGATVIPEPTGVSLLLSGSLLALSSRRRR